MAGARVIPLIYTEPPEVLNQKLNLVNGIIFTGGWAKDGLYFDVIKGIFQKVLEKNDAGEHFPLLAICLGYELLTMIITNDNNILEEFSAVSQASTVQFVENVNIDGTVFGRFPPVLLKKMSIDCLVMQNHHFGISPERFQANKDLSSFFRVLTTSTDENNKVYVSTIQATRYPIAAFQWHPEKNVFEWGSSRIPHSEDAIQVTTHVANYFISEARKSSNKPVAREVLDSLIYNYNPTYGGKAGKGYDEVYLFTPHSSSSSMFPPTLIKKLSKECLVLQSHKYGLSPEKFQANDDLSSFFIMLTTSTDTRNKVYVSTLKAENYPITALQWHPEKSAFEWGSSAIPHTEDAVQVTQLVANYFVSEARKSSNKPEAQKVLDNLIYNYNPTYSGKTGKGYDEVYVFNSPAVNSV